tara:strand:- start:32 stop:328 length:297 start_codon:yes stop_codon:yes gene_type:complete
VENNRGKWMRIKPLNRHLVVQKRAKKEESKTSAFILPEGYESTIQKYSVVRVIDIAEDSRIEGIEPGKDVVVEASMMFEVEGNNLILDNYVYGLVTSD